MSDDKSNSQPKQDTNRPKPQPSKPKQPQGGTYKKSRNGTKTTKLNK